jgi:adenylate cyclase class 2
MEHLNVEIKAHCPDAAFARMVLKQANARFVGEDHQIDTYFNVPSGRLKLREGNIENHLIFYQRSDMPGPKTSEVSLLETNPNTPIKAFLTNALGALVEVDKHREIYFVDNVKFHIDRVNNLGEFLEIEAIDKDHTLGKEYLQEQCRFWMQKLNIQAEDLLSVSYSDLLENKIPIKK